MNMKKDRIIKTSGRLGLWLKWAGVTLVLAGVTQLALIAVAPSLDLSSGAVIDVWGLAVTLNGDANHFRVVMAFSMVGAGIMAAILFTASGIFKDISKEGTPFAAKNAKKIRRVSYLLMAQGIALPPLRHAVLILLVPGIKAASSVSFGSIITAAVFFLLALIFEYGCLLQEESDGLL